MVGGVGLPTRWLTRASATDALEVSPSGTPPPPSSYCQISLHHPLSGRIRVRRVPTRPVRVAAQAQPEPPRTLSGCGVIEGTIHTRRGETLARMSQRVAKRAGARAREDKARAASGAPAYLSVRQAPESSATQSSWAIALAQPCAAEICGLARKRTSKRSGDESPLLLKFRSGLDRARRFSASCDGLSSS